MLNKLLQDPALPEITLVLAILVAIALWQKLNRAAQAMGVVYVVYLLYVLIIPAREPVHAYRSEPPIHLKETVFPDDVPEETPPPKPPGKRTLKEESPPKKAGVQPEKKIPPAKSVQTTSPATGTQTPSGNQTLRLNTIVTCQEVENRQPVGIDSIFTLDKKRVYCVTGIRNLNSQATVYHKWYYQGRLRGTVPITMGWSHNWRAWSYVTLRPGAVGQWRVEVEDSLGQVLGSTAFTVMPADSL
jgi:hypothetical protein